MKDITLFPAWKALQAHYDEIKDAQLKDLFAKDPQRASRYVIEFENNLYLDYSKNRINDKTIALLLQLAEEAGLKNVLLIQEPWAASMISFRPSTALRA